MAVLKLCNDPLAQAKLEASAPSCRLFALEELKIENAKDIIKKAYIAEPKTILIAALFFNIFAQNALLKILEEPPESVEFIIFANSKNALLKTILSRVTLQDLREKKDFPKLDIDLRELNLQKILDFVSASKNEGKEGVIQIIQALLFEASGLKLGQSELQSFDLALKAAHDSHRAEFVLTPLLLMLLRVNDNKSHK